MTNTQMLAELIEMAAKNGWKPDLQAQGIFVSLGNWGTPFIGTRMSASDTDLLFSHSFAEAIFGDVFYFKERALKFVTAWKYYLQQLAITPEPDRIKYAYENRRKDL